jgi:hypothetical protein
MPMSNQPSDWQQKIEGEWHGLPSIFDAAGNHCGYNKVYRSSVFEDGKTTYRMNTKIRDGLGPLLPRLEVSDAFSFGVIDSDRDRIYLGPDFIGAGHPFGTLVDAHYYSPGWTGDLRTMVHILPDGETQVYSSLIYDGPTLFTVFNGIYKVAFDYHTNPETRQRIDAHCEAERINGRAPHILPSKKAGFWEGELLVYGADQQRLGVNRVRVDYRPIDLLRAEMTVSISGVFDKRYTFRRTRNQSKHTFEGPDVYGNSMGYGRALYTSQHFYGEALKIKGREFLIDDRFTLSVVWQFCQSDKTVYTTFGVLHWQER